MAKLTIIRGPSGTGKSTIARHLGGEARVTWFEADMFFDRNGHYEFDGNKLGNAHQWCQDNVYANLDDNRDVIVSNTTTAESELATYLGIAEQLGADVEIIRTPRPWDIEQMKERNVHRVPAKALQRMLNRYVEHEDEIEWTDMSVFKD